MIVRYGEIKRDAVRERGGLGERVWDGVREYLWKGVSERVHEKEKLKMCMRASERESKWKG